MPQQHGNAEYEWQRAQNKNRPFPAGFRARPPETDRVNNLAACAMRLLFLHMNNKSFAFFLERMILKETFFLVRMTVLSQMKGGLVEGVKEMPVHKVEQ
ncbi:hypothetical protein [Aquipseudomonas alcaligenes]|uniref:hypothetical protein n=1 Tax=Aquipseudomonas alcaligenes TaxID=43263 RepID=UPI00117B31C9|nr:hypothetical protein [Pseudomonas alcaligenes]